MPFARSLYSAAVKSGLSIVVIDNGSNQIVAGDFLFNLADRRHVSHHKNMAPILSLLKKFEEPILEEVVMETRGHLMFNFCLFVHKDLHYPEQVKLIFFFYLHEVFVFYNYRLCEECNFPDSTTM